jgi:hypothetical protein
MKSSRGRAFSFLAVVSFLAFCLTVHSSELILVKIGKKPGQPIPPYAVAGLKVIQELETCWIAETSAGELPKLKEQGSRPVELDTNPSAKAYYLVELPRADDLHLLSEYGQVRRIEDRICLFWCEKLNVRDILPSRFRIKRLPAEAVRAQAREQRFPRERERPRPHKFNSDILRMVNDVSSGNLTSSIQRLQDFQTRYASTAQCESAGAYLYDYFRNLGMATEYDPFTFDGGAYSRNIIAVLPGKVAPGREVIICGHYDSYSDQALTLAPGADDNASATAAVMELARVMKDYQFNFSLKFICFSAEEWGLLGSLHYAQEAKKSREKIIAVINMDMIAYVDRHPEDLDIIVDKNSEWLADEFIAAANMYAPLPSLKITNASYAWSDHASFWDVGFSALCGIEDADAPNPFYHQTTDTLSTLDMSFCTDVSRAALAAAANLAEPLSTPPAPTGLRAQCQLSSSLFLTVKTVYLNWDANPSGVKGYNIYRSTTAHSGYLKINSGLLTQPSYTDSLLEPDEPYYYVVTAVDTRDRESNTSEEVRDDENNS